MPLALRGSVFKGAEKYTLNILKLIIIKIVLTHPSTYEILLGGGKINSSFIAQKLYPSITGISIDRTINKITLFVEYDSLNCDTIQI